jgi:hypothetical protein
MTAVPAEVSMPPGAVEVGDWADLNTHDAHRAWRSFNGPKRGIRVEGVSWEDSLPANAAQELSAVLAELSAEIDRWADR